MTPLEWSEQGRTTLFAAYAKAQGAMGEVLKGATNTHFGTKYATLADVVGAVIPAMSANGIAVMQSPSFDGEVLTVETIITHADGGWMKSSLSVRPGKPDAQGLGSAATYLRRYALMSLAGVAPEDDDGNAASATGEGGKKFETQREPVRRAPPGGGRKSNAAVVAAKNAILMTPSDDLANWLKINANAMRELSNDDRKEIEDFLAETTKKFERPPIDETPFDDRHQQS